MSVVGFECILDRELERTNKSESSDRGGSIHSAIAGTLVGFTEEGRTPLVIYPGQPGNAAIVARTIVDLHAAHVGREVVLLLDRGDSRSPIVIGWIRERENVPASDHSGQVEVDVDGKRLVVSAKEQLVLRCGSASITLTRAGKVLIEGSYLSSRSRGVNRIKGGSVQIN